MIEEQVVKLYQDGNQVCALIGDNIMEGIVGFGITRADALRDLADRLEDPNELSRV